MNSGKRQIRKMQEARGMKQEGEKLSALVTLWQNNLLVSWFPYNILQFFNPLIRVLSVKICG